MNVEQAIRMCGLSKTYGKNRGIDDLTFDVESGEIFGFLGPNGAGKSTTIRCLLGLIRPTGGSASVFGQDIVRDHAAVMRSVGYLPSETMFYPDMKAGEVIRFAAKVRGVDCSAEAAKLCERLKVDVNKRIRDLSLGNRKKIAIVCAMQHKPKLFVFDEPTSGLDPLIQAEFFALVQEYNAGGATCFLSSHVLPEVRKYCGRAAIIREGRLVAVDSLEKLSRTNAKRVRLEGVTDLTLDGISQLKKHENGMEFVYSGDIASLLGVLHGQPIADLCIEEPSLEEVFMHYYDNSEQTEDNQTGGNA